jgi:transposase-like protein
VATLGKWFTDASQEENRQVSSAEVAQLKADLLLATQENEILKKALGIFAQKR